jgi:hypothetical protein
MIYFIIFILIHLSASLNAQHCTCPNSNTVRSLQVLEVNQWIVGFIITQLLFGLLLHQIVVKFLNTNRIIYAPVDIKCSIRLPFALFAKKKFSIALIFLRPLLRESPAVRTHFDRQKWPRGWPDEPPSSCSLGRSRGWVHVRSEVSRD